MNTLPFDVDDDHLEFWNGLTRREFLLYRCVECGAWYWPVSSCRNHENEPFFGNMRWQKSSGRGLLFAFNIHRRSFNPAFALDVPYALGVIKLDEGPLFFTRLAIKNVADLKIGMTMEVMFHAAEDRTFAFFTPIDRHRLVLGPE